MKKLPIVVFEFYETKSKNKKSRFGWRARNKQNGKIIADSAEGYTTKQGAIKGLDSMLDARWEVDQKWEKRIKLPSSFQNFEVEE